MKIEDCKPGVAVLYRPIMKAGTPSYPAVVRELPWQLGDGTWVTHLEKVEGYEGRTFIHGAYVKGLVLR